MNLKETFDQIEARPHGTRISDAIDSDLWVWYIGQARELTGERILVKKCRRCVYQIIFWIIELSFSILAKKEMKNEKEVQIKKRV
jgi:hypothetical protein